MHILQIIVKNTSTMDFTLPLLWKAHESHPDYRPSILYCTFDKRQILRRSGYYSHQFEACGVTEYDFACFLKKPYCYFRPLLRWMFSRSPADKMHLRELFQQCKGSTHLSRLVRLILLLLKGQTLRAFVDSLVKSALVWLERHTAPKMIPVETILPRLAPDLVLFDNRSTTTFYGREHFYAYFDEHQKPVVLIPHGPHFRDPISEFTPFDEQGQILPTYCDYWMPLRFGTPWICTPKQKKQYAVVGYPGFDQDWLTNVMNRSAHVASASDKRTRKCLFIVRRYLPAGVQREAGLDPFIVDYEDFMEPLKALSEAIRLSGEEIEVIVKPHPVNNYKELAHDFAKAGIQHWRITHEPIYAVLPEVDLVVSLFSTILLVPALAGIPTLVIETQLQRHVHQEWALLRDLYTKLSFYVEHAEAVPTTFQKILVGGEVIRVACRQDIEHLRYYFPDRAIAAGLNRITWLMTRQKQLPSFATLPN